MRVLKQQHWHLILLIILLSVLYSYSIRSPYFFSGSLWGVSTKSWAWLALIVPIIHQLYVLLCWRLELVHKALSRSLGSAGFTVFKIGFAILILLRPVSITLLAISNAHTLNVSPFLNYLIAGILLLPSIYLFYSVKKYFGINRAFGEDHFKPNQYKNDKLVKKGIFRYTSNGMYLYGFLILYVPGLLLLSQAALALAVFNHLYIWVHYYFIEKPDMEFIYG